jgi:hypothetical protein
MYLTSCVVNRDNSNYFKYDNEILFYDQITSLNDTIIRENKLLWHNNKKLSWFDTTTSKEQSFHDFNFNFSVKSDSIFINYNYKNSVNNRLLFFLTKLTDTLQAVNFHELQNNNIQYKGSVTYKGIKSVRVLNNEIECYVFEIDEGLSKSNFRKEKIKEYYLAKKQLIPIMIVTKITSSRTGKIISVEELRLMDIVKSK